MSKSGQLSQDSRVGWFVVLQLTIMLPSHVCLKTVPLCCCFLFVLFCFERFSDVVLKNYPSSPQMCFGWCKDMMNILLSSCYVCKCSAHCLNADWMINLGILSGVIILNNVVFDSFFYGYSSSCQCGLESKSWLESCHVIRSMLQPLQALLCCTLLASLCGP